MSMSTRRERRCRRFFTFRIDGNVDVPPAADC
jgi:hypothetical protein